MQTFRTGDSTAKASVGRESGVRRRSGCTTRRILYICLHFLKPQLFFLAVFKPTFVDVLILVF